MSHDFEPLSGKIIEAAVAVHKALGPGFLESIYHRAMRVALDRRSIPYENRKPVCVHFEGEDKSASTLLWRVVSAPVAATELLSRLLNWASATGKMGAELG
jgi:hypothetical protein